MRAAARGPAPARPARRAHTGELCLGTALWGALMLGYLPGILAGRAGQTVSAALADHYLDKQNFIQMEEVFRELYTGAFLQATLILLSGFCALGLGLLFAFFALKGLYLGFSAASVFARQGARGLVVHWLMSCLPDLMLLALLFSLALCAAPLCLALLRAAFGTGPQSDMSSLTRSLLKRYLVILAAGAACCALGAGSDVFLASVLL